MAAAVDGAAGWIGVGLASGVLTGGLYLAVTRTGSDSAARQAHAQVLSNLEQDAENRVQAVIKQFEWAVNDLARIKRELEESEADVRVLTERGREREHQNEQLVRQISQLRERLAEIAMAASLTASGKRMPDPLFAAIPLSWGLHLDGPRARLELETREGDESPSRLRVIDGDGQVVAASGVSVLSPDSTLVFQIEPPRDLVTALLAGEQSSYTIEAFVDLQWRPVMLRDTGRRTRSAVDMGGQLSRVSAVGASIISRRAGSRREGRGSALN
ncbi:MAG TPA: hypothetical protein VGR87_02750 [Candidatus Limnocylindria bacterium]|nr:hypothetical protein [Candidatus Limnocylindria bacterium]